MSDRLKSYPVTDVTRGAAKLTLKQAAGEACVSPDTVARWCQRYSIGRQLHRNAPWRVDPVGLRIVAAGDAEALSAYQNGDKSHPSLTPYR